MATTEEEGTHTFADGKETYTKSWKAAGEVAAVLIFIHGFDDHCNRYADFYPNLAKSGIHVHSFDQRGWGRSVKKQSEKGLTGPTSTVIGDIDSFVKSKIPAPAPLFLMGHSMGGQECLIFAATGPVETRKHITGFLAEAPYIRLDDSSQPSSFTVFAGRIAAKMLPHHQMVQKLHPEYMCHDEAVCKDWELDPLCHHTGTLEGLGGMLDRAATLDKGEVELGEDKPLFIGHGTADKVTSHEASKKFFERSKVRDKTIKFYDGCYHCIHLEPEADKKKFTADVTEWILTRAKAQRASIEEGVSAQSKL